MDKKLMAECLKAADELWNERFLGKCVTQVPYNSMGECADSREILGYRSSAVTQIAIELYRGVLLEPDTQESESDILHEVWSIWDRDINNIHIHRMNDDNEIIEDLDLEKWINQIVALPDALRALVTISKCPRPPVPPTADSRDYALTDIEPEQLAQVIDVLKKAGW